MTAATLIDRLDAVRQTGADRWIARCPAHDDRTPSLSIRDADGTVLIRCWAGCTAADIVTAVGLDMSDLFPPLPTGTHSRRPTRHRVPAADRLAIIDREATVVCVITDKAARDMMLTDEEIDRLLEAARRIGEARHG